MLSISCTIHTSLGLGHTVNIQTESAAKSSFLLVSMIISFLLKLLKTRLRDYVTVQDLCNKDLFILTKKPDNIEPKLKYVDVSVKFLSFIGRRIEGRLDVKMQ